MLNKNEVRETKLRLPLLWSVQKYRILCNWKSTRVEMVTKSEKPLSKSHELMEITGNHRNLESGGRLWLAVAISYYPLRWNNHYIYLSSNVFFVVNRWSLFGLQSVLEAFLQER